MRGEEERIQITVNLFIHFNKLCACGEKENGCFGQPITELQLTHAN